MTIPIIISKMYTGNANNPTLVVWVYGLSSGSMIMSASIFLLPVALNQNITFGSIGVGAGILFGYFSHTISHNKSHDLKKYLKDKKELVNLTLHTIFAGSIIGVIYSQVPSISIILGLGIISHKFPASLATASRLKENSISTSLLIIPASVFGLSCYIFHLTIPDIGAFYTSIIFGIGVGIFIHLGMDFIPECEHGIINTMVEDNDEKHKKLDKLRVQSILSVGLGGLIVVLLWYLLI